MNKISIILAWGLAYSVYAEPIFKFEPLKETKIVLEKNDIKHVDYKITNVSPKDHYLQMRKIPGIIELKGTQNCVDKGRLKNSTYCLLRLEIDGNKFERLEDISPRVCADSSSIMCDTPKSVDILKVTIR